MFRVQRNCLKLICLFISIPFGAMNLSSFQIPLGYDFSQSTESNYASHSGLAESAYYKWKMLLDYSYHVLYSPVRQKLHDEIVDKLPCTVIFEKNRACEVPAINWIGAVTSLYRYCF